MKREILLAAGFCSALLLSFQNCTKATYSAKEDPIKYGGGTGNGYDGKLYAIISLTPCPDESYVEAAILVKESANEAYLVRESCQPIPALPLAPQSYSVVSATEITYQGRPYAEVKQEAVGVAPSPVPQKSSLFCDRSVNGEDGYVGRAQIQISANPPMAFISLSDASGSWKRESAPFLLQERNAGAQPSYYYSYAGNDGGYFNFLVENTIGRGSYYIHNVRDVSGYSGRPPVESWQGQQSYSCKVLPW